jgi:rhamnogalacturonan endolyase
LLPGYAKKLLHSILFLCLICPLAARADFGLTTTTNYYTVDTGAGLVFSILRVDNGSSTQSPGDIASLQINGAEYQDQSRGSQINSGFDWVYSNTSAVTVSAAAVGDDYIMITVQAGDLTHYYMARRGYPHIYMATYFTSEPQLGLVRYILRMQRSMLNNGPIPSDISQTVSTVESSDVFALSNGETRSKHYSNHRLKDWSYIGATGDNVGIWVVRDNMEGSSGGPFYRSLLNQGTSTDQEITYIVNYGEVQTESLRTGILNHYTLVVTDGSAPDTNIDTSWFSGMGLTGYVASSGRGQVVGSGMSGMDSNYSYTVGFANSQAQYWTDATSSGSFLMSDMLPGTYTMTVYKNELAVYSTSVRISAGNVTTLDAFAITSDPATASALWRIGVWDGSPQEFLNGDKVTYMHPSDIRMSSWSPAAYYVGTSSAQDFPAYIWKDVNNGRYVYFKLSSTDLMSSHQLRIGLTCGYSNGRPQITVNDWTSPAPSASTQPSTRSLTVGSYRCNNVTYTYTIPSSAWKTSADDWNALQINVISGKTGTGYLSPGISVDAIDLLQ